MPNKPPGKWPHYAEWHRLDAIAALQTIQQQAREAQELMRGGRALEAVILLGDVRERAVEGQRVLEKAKNGER
jgi:hypothetical protein